jgi:ATP-dependent DNA ligase
VTSGKNLGKKNATNVIQQAISEGQSKWNLNARKKGYVTFGSESAAELATVQSDRPKAMALHSLPPQPTDGKFDISGTKFFKEGDPVYMSIKYDGNRLSAAMLPDGRVDLWGRPGDTPPNELRHIREQVAEFIRVNTVAGEPKIILDGEVWAPGIEHQIIHGIFSNAAADSRPLKFMVFDTMIPGVPFETRYDKLLQWFAKSPQPDIVLVVETQTSKSQDIERFYRAALNAGHEGIVLRDPAGVYEMGTRKEIRSKHVVKLKPVMDAEFEITGYKSGEGRDAGSVIWILKTATGKEFSARPAETIEERRAIYQDALKNFETKYLGKMLKIAFGNLTADGIPRFPRVLGFRDQIN